MRHSRLWPVVSAFVLLLAGAIGIEVTAKDHRAQAHEIRITQSSDASESADEELWFVSEPIDEAHASARRWARRGEYDQALRVLERLTAERPDDDNLVAEYGHCLRRAGRYEPARQVIEAALLRNPDGATLHLDLARVLQQVGENDLALTHFQRALELRPNHTGTRVAIGELLRREGRIDQAIRALEPAGRQGSNEERARALGALGKAYFAAGRRQSALEALEASVERAPAAAQSWTRAAEALLLSDEPQDYDAAIEHAIRGTRLAPNSASAFRVLGRAYSRSDMPTDSIRAYEEVVARETEDGYSRRLLIRAALDGEEYAIARRHAQVLLRLEPDRAESHFLAGLVESRAGSYAKARGHYLEAIRKSKSPYAEAWYNLGRLARRRGSADEAVAAYQKALEGRPNYVAAWNNLGLVYLDESRHAEAESSFRKAIEIDGAYVGAWTNLGDGYSKQQRYSDAIDAYERALALDPKRVANRLRLAVALRRAGRSSEAIRAYETLVSDEPRYTRAWYNLGVALALSGRLDEAERAYQTALSIDPNHFRSLKNLGLLEAKRGRWAAAEPHLKEALERRPDDAEVRSKLAQSMLATGDLQGCSHHASLVRKQSQADDSLQVSLVHCVGR